MVEVEPGPLGEPCADLGVLVGGVVVENRMQVEIGRRLPVDLPQEGEELLVAVALGALPDHLAGRRVQGGEQRRGSVADVVVC